MYDGAAVDRLRFIRRCRELGFPLPEIRTLLHLVDGGNYTCAEVKTLTLAQRDAVRAKIRDLARMERVLDEMAERCAGGTVPDCAIIDTLFERS
jgi:MerR family mercuric resistance operon transcriptional regulator